MTLSWIKDNDLIRGSSEVEVYHSDKGVITKLEANFHNAWFHALKNFWRYQSFDAYFVFVWGSDENLLSLDFHESVIIIDSLIEAIQIKIVSMIGRRFSKVAQSLIAIKEVHLRFEYIPLSSNIYHQRTAVNITSVAPHWEMETVWWEIFFAMLGENRRKRIQWLHCLKHFQSSEFVAFSHWFSPLQISIFTWEMLGIDCDVK
jgi:hypothetical protein